MATPSAAFPSLFMNGSIARRPVCQGLVVGWIITIKTLTKKMLAGIFTLDFSKFLKEDHMKKFGFVVSVLWVMFLVLPSYAQMGKGAGPKFYGDFKPVVGAWAEYQITEKGGQPAKMKIAVVGKEGNDYWYETVMETKQEGRIISKMLVSGSPDSTSNVKRMIFKNQNEPAMEMPVQMMQMSPAARKEGTKGKFADKGTESIKVPAGSFKARHLQYQDGPAVVDTWVQKDVAPYGMVKSLSKESEMVLVGYGTGAKTLITETPQKFEMPQMPQMPSKRK
jgi:hypothetical protein